MSVASPAPKRIILLGFLWTVIGLAAWLLAVQLAMIIFASKGQWQAPDFYQVTVVDVEKDTTNAFTRDVNVTIDGAQDTLTLPKPDAAKLHPYDTLWILDNFYATPIRPAQFILTPGRVLSEYPEFTLLLALLILLRLRRSRWGLHEPIPVPAAQRHVFRDTFHSRAQRHASQDPHVPPSTSSPNPLQ